MFCICFVPANVWGGIIRGKAGGTNYYKSPSIFSGRDYKIQ